MDNDLNEELNNNDASADTEENAENIKTENKDDASPENKVEIAGIKFKKSGKTYYFAPGGFTLGNDDRVIVDTSRGQEYGYVAVPNKFIKPSDVVLPLRQVVRMATPEDTRIHEENLKREIDAFNSCIVLIDRHGLQMKLIDVEYAFDRSKLLFYFSAEERVDFRELVKDLASEFHTRIEMRQIGIRDEAKMLGGLGICGRPFCCACFLTDFVQVSVKMAKEQGLSINSAKISGACGRLMCCLRYEYDTYLSEKAITPKNDTRVMTPDGPGVVTDSNPLAGIVKVRLDAKPDDADQVIYVREDVVKADEYKGETLTKTALPDRSSKNKEEKDLFGELRIIGQNEPTVFEKTDKAAAENRTESERPGNEQTGKTSEPDGNFKNRGGFVPKNKNRGNGKPGNPQQKNNTRPQNNRNAANENRREETEEEKENKPQNKKKFKPYYKKFKKKNGGDGNNQQ